MQRRSPKRPFHIVLVCGQGMGTSPTSAAHVARRLTGKNIRTSGFLSKANREFQTRGGSRFRISVRGLVSNHPDRRLTEMDLENPDLVCGMVWPNAILDMRPDLNPLIKRLKTAGKVYTMGTYADLHKLSEYVARKMKEAGYEV